MLRVRISNDRGIRVFEHEQGPLVLGRSPDQGAATYVVADPRVSRNHLELREIDVGRVELRNLSRKNPVWLGQDDLIEACRCREVTLPTLLRIGESEIQLEQGRPAPSGTELNRRARTMVEQLGDSPDAETLATWFQRVVRIQHAAAGSEAFYTETARAVVDLIGLDRGLVLLRRDDDWEIAACEQEGNRRDRPFSRSVLDAMLASRTTQFENPDDTGYAASLAEIEAVVAAPIFDAQRTIVGAVYGSRARGDRPSAAVRPLEAKLVQVLASAAGAGMIRQDKEREVTRVQVQLEQAFSAPLARELLEHPELLEGSEREVTVMFTDLRGFTSLAERLGPRETFRFVQRVMEMQSAHVLDADGVIVDYLGDGMLSMWNVPTDQVDHADRACRVAIAIHRDLLELAQSVDHPLAMGIGINTGRALVGNTGSRLKVKYGPMGATVNLGSRVEGTVKHLGVPAVLTGATRAALTQPFAMRRLCAARLVGVAEPVELFELRCGDRCASWEASRDRYEAALSQFEARRWEDACRTIQELLADEDWRRDTPTLNLLARSVECMRDAPADFDPAERFLTK